LEHPLGKEVVTAEVAAEVCLTLLCASLIHVGARLAFQARWHSGKTSMNTHIFLAMQALPCGLHMRRVVLRHLFLAHWPPHLLC